MALRSLVERDTREARAQLVRRVRDATAGWVREEGHEEGCVCVKEDEETIRQKIGVLANVYIPETHWQRPGRYHKQTSQEPCCQAATHPSITAAYSYDSQLFHRCRAGEM
jgi:hypothetical protein